MQFLRQNTAVIVTVGPFYDKTDGVTLKTALTITNERITLTADTDDNSAPTNVLDNVTGATSGTSNDLNYITGNDAAMMQMELSAANTNRVGRMMLSITDSANHVPVFQEFFVLPQAIYDWLTGVIVPLPANVTTISGSSVSTSTAQLGVNVVNFGGSAGTFASGRPETNMTHIAGSAVSTSSAQIGVNVVNAGATAWGSGAITAASIAADAITAAKIADNAIDRATFAADTGLQSVRSNTAQTGAAGSITLDASASATNDLYKGAIVYLTGGTGAGQYRVITGYTGATKVATVAPNWATNPDNTSTFAVQPAGMTDLEIIQGAAVSTSTAQLGVNTVQAGATAWGSGAITAASIASNAITSAKIATDAIGAAQIAADAIGASELAADAVTEIQTAVAAGAVASVTGAVGSVTGNVGGNVVGSVGSVTGAVGSVTGNVGGNVTGSVGSVAAAGISSSSLASSALNAIADGILDRNMATGTDNGTNSTAVRTTRQALRPLRNKVTIAAGTATVTKEDDSTTSWTAAITTAAGNPLSGVDPT